MARQSLEHEEGYDETNEGSDGCCVAFEVRHEETVLADPCGSIDAPLFDRPWRSGNISSADREAVLGFHEFFAGRKIIDIISYDREEAEARLESVRRPA